MSTETPPQQEVKREKNNQVEKEDGNKSDEELEQMEGSHVEKHQNQDIKLSLPKWLKQYHIKPTLRGVNKILYLNAQDIAYYQRKLLKPNLKVWILRAPSTDGLNYTVKRIIEEGFKLNIQVTVMVSNKFELICSNDGLDQIFYKDTQLKPEDYPDAVLPRFGAKIDYFGLSILMHLEKMEVNIINETESLEISRDKLYTVRALSENKMPIPKTMLAKFPINKKVVKEVFGDFPVIFKVASGSQGKGVMLVKDEDCLSDIGDLVNKNVTYLIQEFIKNSSGRDIRVIVIGEEAIGGMMRIAKSGFKSNFSQGGYVTNVELTPKLKWLACEATKICKLQISGVDILIDKNTYKICEINSTPGFEGFELGTGINVADHILKYVAKVCGIKKLIPKKKKKDVVRVEVSAEHLMPINNDDAKTGTSKKSLK